MHPGDREQALAATFVSLADTLTEDYDVAAVLDQLVRAGVDLLGAAAAGLLLDDQKGSIAVVATSSEETRQLEAFQVQSNDGPGVDCIHSGRPVACDDLAAEAARWPLFAPVALDAGFNAVVAVPMRLREQTIGGLSLFQAGDQVLGEAERQLARALADVATIGILQHRSAHRSSMLTEQLQQALNSRVIIEQAKGVLAERHGLSMAQAFEALRRHSRDHNLKLTEHAFAVVRETAGD